MAKKLRNTSTAAQHRKSKLHVEDVLEEAVKPDSEEDVDDTSQQGASTAAGAAKSAGRTVSNAASKHQQRKAIRDAQIAAAQQEKMAKEGTEAAGKFTDKAADVLAAMKQSMVDFVRRHPSACAFVLIGILVLMLFSSVMTSCSAFLPAGTNTVLGSVYTAEDADILGADADYTAMESGLRSQVNAVETDHAGYDEYRYELDEIGHNPYELASYLTILFEAYTREQVQDTLAVLFEAQYDLTFEETSETRTRIVELVDPETGLITQLEEEYIYRILTTTLENHGLGTVIGLSGLTEDEMARFAVLNQTFGGRPDLFGDDIYVSNNIPYPDYEVPPEALTDERFARMLQVAEQFLGYPYVWGGSSPSTSFDCSGYISWVINHSNNGWNVGRLTCNGLAAQCTLLRPEDAKPGDLIFFQGTYDTDGFSHVGLYVGNGMMIHCGNPIQYANITEPYWVAHFAAFGRLP